MKSLNVYSEHIINSPLGSIKENISGTLDKRKVLRHLKNANVIATFPGITKDIFTGENISGEWLLLSDGVYEWSSDIIYYYERYNLKLLPEFVFYIENPEIYAGDYLCRNRKADILQWVKSMSNEEIVEQFELRERRYSCDYKEAVEDAKRIRNMTDEEFQEHLEYLAFREKESNPDKIVLCPRCGKELRYREAGKSYEIKCSTDGCIKMTCRGI